VIGVLILLILLVPVIELWVIIEVWQAIGGLPTLGLLVLVSVLGAWLVKREGVGVWQRMNDQLAQGRMPAFEVIDGAVILFAGALLLTPGFVTDIVAIFLLLPPTRAGIKVLARRRVPRPVRVATWGVRTSGFRSPADGDVIDVMGEEVAPTARRPSGGVAGELDR
jgi:UPF0716 protein FxsA